MKAYTRSRGTAPLFLNLGARLKWVVNVTLRPLHPHESTYRTGGWMGPRVGLDALEKWKNLFPCRGTNHGNAVYGNNRYLFRLSYLTRKFTLWVKKKELHLKPRGIYIKEWSLKMNSDSGNPRKSIQHLPSHESRRENQIKYSNVQHYGTTE